MIAFSTPGKLENWLSLLCIVMYLWYICGYKLLLCSSGLYKSRKLLLKMMCVYVCMCYRCGWGVVEEMWGGRLWRSYWVGGCRGDVGWEVVLPLTFCGTLVQLEALLLKYLT